MTTPSAGAMRAARAIHALIEQLVDVGGKHEYMPPSLANIIDRETNLAGLVEAAKPFAILGSTVDLSRFDGESRVELVTPAKGKSRGSHRLYVEDITRLRDALTKAGAQ